VKKSIVTAALAVPESFARDLNAPSDAKLYRFSAKNRMSGVDLSDGSVFAKGAPGRGHRPYQAKEAARFRPEAGAVDETLQKAPRRWWCGKFKIAGRSYAMEEL